MCIQHNHIHTQIYTHTPIHSNTYTNGMCADKCSVASMRLHLFLQPPEIRLTTPNYRISVYSPSVVWVTTQPPSTSLKPPITQGSKMASLCAHEQRVMAFSCACYSRDADDATTVTSKWCVGSYAKCMQIVRHIFASAASAFGLEIMHSNTSRCVSLHVLNFHCEQNMINEPDNFVSSINMICRVRCAYIVININLIDINTL